MMLGVFAINASAWALDLAGGILTGVGLIGIILVAGMKLPAASDAHMDEHVWGATSRLVARISPRAAIIGIGLYVAAVISLGTLAVALELPDRILRLNQEHSIPAYASTLLLYAVGLIALLIGRLSGHAGHWWAVLGIVFVAFGFSEAAELHERVELRTGLPVLIIIAPLGALGALAWLKVMPQMKQYEALPLFASGIGVLIVSQATDPFHNKWKSVVEEALEMGGSACLLIALLVIARALQSEISTDRDMIPHPDQSQAGRP